MSDSINPVDIVLFSVDPVIMTLIDDNLHVLAVKRTSEPFKGLWGLPGGRVDKACKNLDEALALKLKQKTGLDSIYFEQLQTYGSNEMDPRGWSVTTAYLSLVHKDSIDFIALPESHSRPEWIPLKSVVNGKIEMAFWHKQIISDAFERLKSKSLYTDLPANLMAPLFTIATLRSAYEAILGCELTRQSFAKRMESANIFIKTDKVELGSHRAPPLYRKRSRGGNYYFPRQLMD